MKNILLVEDDHSIASLVKEYLADKSGDRHLYQLADWYRCLSPFITVYKSGILASWHSFLILLFHTEA
jgi:hypothetical protein